LSFPSATRDGSEKDTLQNIRETQVFCIHLVEESWAEEMNLTSGTFRPDESEFDLANLAHTPCKAISGRRIRGARACMECRAIDIHTYGRKAKSNIVVGQVLHYYVEDEIMDAAGKTIDPQKIQPLGRLGGVHYAGLGQIMDMARPDVDLWRKSRSSGDRS
jgi:flavin reductase (DIM6/NTAB) family NADH-FMN oxidoreductase RutF